MTYTKPLLEGRIIALFVIVVAVLLYLILKPIISSNGNKNIRATKVNDRIEALIDMPKDYTEIQPEPEKKVEIKEATKEKKIIRPPSLSIKPDKVEFPKKKILEPIIQPVKKVVVKPVKKEPTEYEKAVAKGRASGIGFSAFKAVKIKSKKENNHSIKVSLKKPATKYLISAGTIISAITVSGINSDLPGHIVARIDRNIYDSISGQYLLIPQGSKLIGSYKSNVKLNQKRIEISWEEIKLSDGSTVELGKGQPGIGNQGMSGVTGDVDNHYFSNAISIFSVALLNSSAKGIHTASSGSFEDEVSGDVANAGSDIFRKQVQLGPTIKIPIASPIRLLITKDLIFEEPYNAKKF